MNKIQISDDLKLLDFDYHLPTELIAQEPANPRESARLMTINPGTFEIIDTNVAQLPDFLQSNDLVVINNTKVFPARLKGELTKPDGSKKTCEVFLIKSLKDDFKSSEWQVIGKPGKHLLPGVEVKITTYFFLQIIEKHPDHTMTVKFNLSAQEVINKTYIHGTVPLPPYIKYTSGANEYQTVYAKHVGSVAAPTAGFHLTENILKQIKTKGVKVVEITLHVGLGTFLPIKTEKIADHVMHEEWVEITPDVADEINKTKQTGGRIVAIGTTTTRALEGAFLATHPHLTGVDKENETMVVCKPYIGNVNLFITPGFEFKVVEVLLTNFHLPKSTLLLLVSAFAGTKLIQAMYKHAVDKKYRFFSFGDCMLLTNKNT